MTKIFLTTLFLVLNLYSKDIKMEEIDKFIRLDSKCGRCPLDITSKNRVHGRGNLQNLQLGEDRIIFLGEAPGKEEDEQGIPFVGRSGKCLDTVLATLDIDRKNHWTTNTICCRPPYNNYNHIDSKIARSLCLNGFYEEIKYLKDFNYTKIIAMGNNVCNFLNIDPIKFSNGEKYFLMGYKVFPVYHPSYLIRNIGNNYKDHPMILSWRDTLDRAIKE